MTPDHPLQRGGRPDLLVVGGGVHGLFAAWDAASRGLRVILVDADDFGSGLSFNHQRTIHGGLRALETGRVSAVRAQVEERRTWARMAPHLVDPLAFLIGTYRWSRRSRLAVRLGFGLYDRLSADRNQGLPARLHLPATSLVSAARARACFPGIADRGLTGGAVWHDYQLRQPDRLNWLVALAAREAGATLANYVTAVRLLEQDGQIAGAHLQDALTGETFDLEARLTLVAAGRGLGVLVEPRHAPPLVRAMNLLLDRPAPPVALAARAGSGRTLTVVPWQGYALVGTHQSDAFVDAGAAVMPDGEVDAAVAEAASAFPHLDITREAVRLVHHGLTPGTARGGRAELQPESRVLSAGADLPSGLFAIVGVKFTTARQTAEAAVDRVCATLRHRAPSCTATTPLPHAEEVAPGWALPDGPDREVGAHLVDWYGTEAAAVVAWSTEHGLLEVLPGTSVMAGEIDYAVEHAQPRRLADVVLRRTSLGATGHPGAAALARAAAIMAARLGWSDDRRQAEIALVERRFPAGPARATPRRRT